MGKSRFAAVVFVVFAVAVTAGATTITSVTSGNWNNVNTWSPAQIPTVSDDVVIVGGTGVTIPVGYSALANSLTIQGDIVSPSSLDLDNSGASLTVTTTVTFTAPGSSMVDQLIVGQGALTCGDISLDAGSSGGISRVAVSSGTVSANSVSFAGTPSTNSEFKFTGAGALTLTGNLASGGSFVAATNSTVTFTGSTVQSIGAYSYYNLTINKAGGKAGLLGSINVGVSGTGGSLTIAAGKLLDSGFQIVGNNTGSLSMNNATELDLGSGAGSTLLPLFASYSLATTSTVGYQGQAAQSIEAAPTYGNLKIDTVTATASMSGATTVAGDLTVATGTLNLGNFTHSVAGNWSNSATVVPSSGTVNFSGTSPQSISRGGSAFNNVAFSGGGTKSIITSGLLLNGDLTINSGATVDFGTNLHQIAGNWTNSGNFTGTGSTIEFNGAAGSQNISASGFYNLSFNGAATKTATGALTIVNNVVINSGATFDGGSFTHNVGGSWTNNGTFTTGTSTINFNGSSAQSIGASTFKNISFTNAGLKTSTGAADIFANLTINASASVNGGTGVNNIGGNFTNNGTLTNTANTWNFNGSATPQTIGGTNPPQFANLTVNTGLGVTLTSSILVNGTLNLSSFKITTGANAVVINSGGSVTRTTGFVIGELKKKNVTGAQAFEIGTAGGYSPVTLTSISAAADIGVSAVAGNACCVFAGTNHLAHYWQFIASSPAPAASFPSGGRVTKAAGDKSQSVRGENTSFGKYSIGAVDDSTHTATLAGASIQTTATSWTVGEAASLGGAPTISGFTPTSGSIGSSVVISGSGFTNTTAVAFNGTNASTYSIDNDTQITATVPSGATTGPVTVTTPGGTASNGTFTVASAPTVAGFSPTAGSIGVTVVISGTGFTGATAVTFNGTSAAYNVDNDTQITASVPSGATSGQIAVTTGSGTGTSAGSFTVNAPGLIQSAASGNWTSPATWVGNVLPGTFDNVEILSGHTVTLTANASCAGLSVNSGSTLDLASFTLTDSASGSFFGTVNGSAGILNFSTNSGSTIDGIATIAPAVSFSGDRNFANTANLAFSNGISITTGATVTNNGAVHVDNANGITGTGTFTQAAGASVTNGGPFLPAGTLNAAASPNSIAYNGAAQTVKATAYDSLTFTGSGAKDITGVTTIAGSLTLSGTVSVTAANNLGIGAAVNLGSGTSFDLGSFTHTVGGNWTNSGGSVTQGGSTVIFAGSGAQTINRGTQGFANIQFSGSGAKSFAGAGLFVTGNVTINAGATVNGGAFAHQVTGNWTNNGSFNGNTSSVEFQGGTSSIINGDFSTLIVNKSGAATVTLSGTADVTSTTQLSAGTLIIGTQSLITGSITGSGAITMTTGKIFQTGSSNLWSGTFTAGTCTVELNGTGAQSIRGGTYNNVKLNKASGTATMANALTVNGLLWIANGTLADNGFQMVAGGSATLQIDNAGSLTLGTGAAATSLPAFSTFTLTTGSTVTYAAASSSQQINTTPSYGHLIVDSGNSAGITKSLTGLTLNAASLDITNGIESVTLDLAGKIAVIAGNPGGTCAISFAASTSHLTVGGNFSNSGTFTAGLSTVTYSGTSAQAIRAITYDNLEISNSGATATLAGSALVNGTMTVNAGASYSSGIDTLNLQGDTTNNGTFTGGTVAFTGSSTQNWSGSSIAALNNVTVANPAGVNFNKSITAAGLFGLDGGNVTITGGESVAITGSLSSSNGSWFIGQLQLALTGSTPATFRVGTAAGYAPVNVTPTASGNFAITAVAGAHPNRTGTNLLSRYWTINAGAIPSVDLQFSWNPSDVTGAEAIYTAGRYSGGVWSRPASTINTATHTATVTGITSYSGDWTAGEPLSLGGSATCVTVPAGAVSWWRAQGNAVDDKGTNNGTLNGGAITAGGKVGQAFSFNGTSAYVSAPDSASLHPANLSVEGWFFVSGNLGTTRMIVSKPSGTGVEDSFFVYVANDETIAAGVGTSAATDILASTVTVTPSTWHHFAYTYDGSTQAIYLDGTLANAAITATAAGYTANPFLIGADNDNGSFTNFFNGSIDEVTLYNSVLTAGQIASIYGADSAGKCFSAPAPNITGFTPTSGLTGAAVTITGSGFTGTNSVKFNGTSATYTVDSDTQLTATVPGGATTGPIAVTTAGGTFTSGGNFTVFTGAADLQVSVS